MPSWKSFWRKKIKRKDKNGPTNIDGKTVRMVVTGVCTEKCQEKLQKDLENKGVKAVVTSSPVLGVFDV